jgi:ketosteroid isomerase-like protein
MARRIGAAPSDFIERSLTMRIATEHPYVTRVRRAKEEFDRNRNNPAPLYDLHAEDVVLHAPGSSPLGGGVRGRTNVFSRLQQMAELSGGTFEAVSTSLSGNGNFVALLHHVIATRGDKRLDQTLAELWRFENNRCVEVWAQFSDQRAWDAFWR